jgi:putative hydrolase
MGDSINATIAARFDEVALLLEQQGANPYRVAAYRQGASTLRGLAQPVTEILEQEGIEGLMRLPGIGTGLSRSISILVTTGQLPLLDRLRGEIESQKVLMTVPGIGPKLAETLHDDLGINSLEDLETAAFDGRLANLAGFGEKRLAGIRDVLARRLGRMQPLQITKQPPLQELLEVDREYREKAQAGTLRMIAPRRFNPSGEAWLPILHVRRGERDFTALYSNTKRAHDLKMTRDWVVIYSDDGDREVTSTVVTAQRGPLKGLRVVRGREAESAAYHEASGQVEKNVRLDASPVN